MIFSFLLAIESVVGVGRSGRLFVVVVISLFVSLFLRLLVRRDNLVRCLVPRIPRWRLGDTGLFLLLTRTSILCRARRVCRLALGLTIVTLFLSLRSIFPVAIFGSLVLLLSLLLSL